ncbi:hypothetical protein DYB37_007728 [Aphanomyces astaci]|uniref:dolichyl-P-Man:Man5GlcNAc2-PP-dolichol alpha-1,3-mannosyltransferase n=1 Tax=Aphanomyces astaci TaxID=112090 RepID=A0A418E572_APHAT|nr:hypothetical protein DYB37_007728 [Aphanomyces astaci]
MAGGKAKGTNLRSDKRTTRIDKDVKKVSATNKLLSYAYDLLWSYRTWVDCSVTVVVFVDTEIDWKAYMQQVTQFKNGERDYLNIRGDTGPLVYPAGHVYIYSILHWVTNNGQDIRLAQYVFLGFYLITISAIFAIFYRSRVAPPWTAILVCTSKRLHSIYMLRLFNDGIAMMFLFIAIYLCCRQQWRLGCLVYSFAVSIKMNVLLFAPALFFLLLQSSGVLRTIGYLSICASLQVALALPFLKTFWWSYLTKAFEFSRVFTYTWTVNWKCIPEHVRTTTTSTTSTSGVGTLKETSVIRFFCFLIVRSERVPIRVERIVTSLCVVNFVGICFARTLHYQFYAWYFPTLPYLLWKTNMPLIFKAKVLIICEFAFNTFPATDVSSTVLHLSHFMLLASLFTASDESKYQSYLDAETRQDLTHFVNEECFDAARQFAMYYGSVTEELAEGAKVVSVRLCYARRVLSGMSKEAEDGLARGVNMGQVMTRDYNEFKKNNNEAADDGELNVQLRRRK